MALLSYVLLLSEQSALQIFPAPVEEPNSSTSFFSLFAIWFSLLLIPIFVYLFWRDEPFARACLRSCHEDFPIVQIFALVTVMHDSIETHILFLPWKILPGISHPLRPYGLPSALMETFLSVAVSCEGRRRSFPKLRLSRKKKKNTLPGVVHRDSGEIRACLSRCFYWLPVCVCVCWTLPSIKVHSWLFLTPLMNSFPRSL